MSTYTNTIGIDDMAQASGFCDVSKSRKGCNGIDKKTLVDKVQSLKQSLGAMDSENREKTEHTISVCESIIAGMSSGTMPKDMVREDDLKALTASIRHAVENNADLQGKSPEEIVDFFFDRKNAKGDIKNARLIFAESDIKEFVASPGKDDSVTYHRVNPFPKEMINLIENSSYASNSVKDARRALIDELLEQYTTNSFSNLKNNVGTISKQATQSRQANSSRKALDSATGVAKELIEKVETGYASLLSDRDAFKAFFLLFQYPEILLREGAGKDDISAGMFFGKADGIRKYLGINFNDACVLLADVLPYLGYGIDEEVYEGALGGGNSGASTSSNAGQENNFNWGTAFENDDTLSRIYWEEIKDCTDTIQQEDLVTKLLLCCTVMEKNIPALKEFKSDVFSKDFKRFFVLNYGTNEVFEGACNIYNRLMKLEPRNNPFYNRNDTAELCELYEKVVSLKPIITCYRDEYSSQDMLAEIAWKIRIVNWADKLKLAWLAGTAILSILYIFK